MRGRFRPDNRIFSSLRATSLRVLVVVGLLMAYTAGASAADDLEAQLARPASPGTLALMIDYAADTRVHQYWATALTHQDAPVRATAARLLYAGGVIVAVPQLATALMAEQDEEVVVELATALLALQGPAAIERVLAAAQRVGPSRLAQLVTESYPEAGIARISQVLALPLSAEDRRNMARALISEDEDARARLATAAIAAGDADFWHGVLWAAYVKKLSLPHAQLEAALTSPARPLRDLTWWFVALLAARGEPVPEPARTQLAEGSARTDDGPEAFGRELALRAFDQPPLEQTHVLKQLASLSEEDTRLPLGRGAMQGPFKRLLTPAERKAFDLQQTDEDDAAERRTTPVVGPKTGSEFHSIRTVGAPPDGYVDDVLRLTGCKPPEGVEFAGAVVGYDAQHRVRDLRWVTNRLNESCARAGRYILVAGLVPPAPRTDPDAKVLLLVSMRKKTLACLASSRTVRPGTPAPRPVRTGPRIKVPSKTRHVPPRYPIAAQQQGRQGIVIAEASVSPTGCVHEVRVIRSAATDLDIAAIDAVSQWEFTPTLLDGTPVPMIMTVTVQFTLR